jgi:hypothetical protein
MMKIPELLWAVREIFYPKDTVISMDFFGKGLDFGGQI